MVFLLLQIPIINDALCLMFIVVATSFSMLTSLDNFNHFVSPFICTTIFFSQVDNCCLLLLTKETPTNPILSHVLHRLFASTQGLIWWTRINYGILVIPHFCCNPSSSLTHNIIYCCVLPLKSCWFHFSSLFQC